MFLAYQFLPFAELIVDGGKFQFVRAIDLGRRAPRGNRPRPPFAVALCRRRWQLPDGASLRRTPPRASPGRVNGFTPAPRGAACCASRSRTSSRAVGSVRTPVCVASALHHIEVLAAGAHRPDRHPAHSRRTDRSRGIPRTCASRGPRADECPFPGERTRRVLPSLPLRGAGGPLGRSSARAHRDRRTSASPRRSRQDRAEARKYPSASPATRATTNRTSGAHSASMSNG